MEGDKEVFEDEITCPYCRYVYRNSSEFPDAGVDVCIECGKKFNYSRNVSVSYNCCKDCELNGEKHDFEWKGEYSGGAFFCRECPKLKLKEKRDAKSKKVT